MKNLAFACKAKDLRKNLKFLWNTNKLFSCENRYLRLTIINSIYGVSSQK